jgi:hypothetical protein
MNAQAPQSLIDQFADFLNGMRRMEAENSSRVTRHLVNLEIHELYWFARRVPGALSLVQADQVAA